MLREREEKLRYDCNSEAWLRTEARGARKQTW